MYPLLVLQQQYSISSALITACMPTVEAVPC
jgi:hypothetical protein